VLKKISNTTKFYCPNKSIYYFFKINTNIFRQSMLISFWIDVQGVYLAHAPPPPKIEKNKIFWRKIVIFYTKYPQNIRASLRSAQLF
jgi:hypothetical protein